MFQFPGLPLFAQFHVFNMEGFPIRTSTDQHSFAVPRSFSQLTTSFVVSESLGIPRTPLVASCSYELTRVNSSSSFCVRSILLLSLRLLSPALSMNFYKIRQTFLTHSLADSYGLEPTRGPLTHLPFIFFSTSYTFPSGWRISESNR